MPEDLRLLQGATRVDQRFLEYLSSVLGEDTVSEWLADKVNTEDYQVHIL
jgi:hypothetical protein